MSPKALFGGPAPGGAAPPFHGCSWYEDCVAEPPLHTLRYDRVVLDGLAAYRNMAALYTRMGQATVIPTALTGTPDEPSIGSVTGGDAHRALFLPGRISPAAQAEITFGLPDSPATPDVWFFFHPFLALGTPGPSTWEGTGQPFTVHLENGDASVIVELTTASVTQNYSLTTACNGHIIGAQNSYVIAATSTGSALVPQAPYDIIAPPIACYGDKPASSANPLTDGLYYIFASVDAGFLHVEWWNNIYCSGQHQTYELPLDPVSPSNGFTRATVTLRAPTRRTTATQDYVAMILQRFERVCTTRAADPFGVL